MSSEEKQKIIEVDPKDAIEIIKNTMLGLSPDISCNSCDKPHCCRGQRFVEIAQSEFEQIKPLIQPKHMIRAKKQIEAPRMSNGFHVYDCPFNDPDTGKCDIYEYRFVVCASYGVYSPIDHCDTSKGYNGTQVANPMHVFTSIKDEATLAYLSHHASDAVGTNIIDEFRKLL